MGTFSVSEEGVKKVFHALVFRPRIGTRVTMISDAGFRFREARLGSDQLLTHNGE